MKMIRTKLFAAIAAAMLVSFAAYAAGTYTNGLPAATLPLTGITTIPGDTNLSGGRNPQTVSITIDQLQGLREGALTDAATMTPNANTSTYFTVTLGGNRTIANPSVNPAGSGYVRFLLTQDATGSRTVTWGALYKWFGGVAPTLSTTGGRSDLISCLYNSGSTSYLCDKQLNVIK